MASVYGLYFKEYSGDHAILYVSAQVDGIQVPLSSNASALAMFHRFV